MLHNPGQAREETMSQGTFKKMEQTDQPLYGPRAALVCGFSAAERETVMRMLENIPLKAVSVVFATAADNDRKLSALFALPDRSGRNGEAGPVRAIILAGITEKELHLTLAAYRETGLARPLWATLTPFSENWTLADLIAELEKERAAMENRKGPGA
jgi:hypothetical protein